MIELVCAAGDAPFLYQQTENYRGVTSLPFAVVKGFTLGKKNLELGSAADISFRRGCLDVLKAMVCIRLEVLQSATGDEPESKATWLLPSSTSPHLYLYLHRHLQQHLYPPPSLKVPHPHLLRPPLLPPFLFPNSKS